MVFSSFVFLLVFLPAVLVCYYLLPPRWRNGLLFFASLLFYGWGEPRYVLIMLFSTVFDYTNGRLIARFQGSGRVRAAKAALVLDLCGNLAILGFFKYTDFVLGTVNTLTGAGLSLLHIALPIGISFYTFQTMSYTIDVYRGVIPAQKNILNFGTYVVLFPQLIAGPIVQYKTIALELEKRHVGLEDFAEGAFGFVVGLAKKVLLANQIGALYTEISGNNSVSVATAWLGAVAYTFQIYFDFSGYSDMAVGLGRMFGFHFPQNFNYPYISRTITEFWRRWHISLSSWFREYVYIPLGGNRKGLPRQLRNILIVWFLTGLWHGASWNFVLWGLYYGLILMLEKLFLLRLLERLPHWAGHVYSLFLIVIGWMIFAQTDFAVMGTYLGRMFGMGAALVDGDFLYYLSCNWVLLVLLVIASIPWKQMLERERWNRWNRWKRSSIRDAARTAWMLALFVLSVAFLVGDSYNPFLYFRF